MYLAIRGNDFFLIVGVKEGTLELVDRKLTQISTLFAKLTSVFWQFWGRKSHIRDFLKVVLELFRKCLGIVFDLKRPTFGCIFSSKG